MVEVFQHDIKTGWAHGKKAPRELPVALGTPRCVDVDGVSVPKSWFLGVFGVYLGHSFTIWSVRISIYAVKWDGIHWRY